MHEGQGLQFGHYYAIIKSQGKWMKFDDTRVSIIPDLETQIYYGEPPMNRRSSGWPCAYMLIYESEDLLDEFFMPNSEGSGSRQASSASRQQSGAKIDGAVGAKDRGSKNNLGTLR